MIKIKEKSFLGILLSLVMVLSLIGLIILGVNFFVECLKNITVEYMIGM